MKVTFLSGKIFMTILIEGLGERGIKFHVYMRVVNSNITNCWVTRWFLLPG